MLIHHLRRLLLCCALLSAPLQAAYTAVRTISINHLKVPNTDQVNLPVLFSGTYSYLKTTGNGGDVTSASGYDIVFASSNTCSTVLDFQIDTYAPTTGAVNFWIRVPSISHTVDTDIYICYGNAVITTSQENVSGVFPISRYGEVYHFGSTAAFTGTDSSAISGTGNPLTGGGGATGTLSGKIGAAASFNGTTSYGSTGNAGNPSSAQARTTSIWFKLNSSPPTGYRMLYGSGNWSFNGAVWDIFYSQADSGMAMVLGGFNQPWPWTPDTNWHRVSVTLSGTTSASIQMYMDGVALTSTNLGALALSTISGGGSLSVGAAPQVSNYFFDGLLDEGRNEFGAKSADWIMTEYNNQNDPATFYTISGVAAVNAANALGAQLQGQGSVY